MAQRTAKKAGVNTFVMTTRVQDHNRGTFGTKFLARLDEFERLVDSAAAKAAAEAERVSKNKARALRPPSAPRKGRREAPGALARAINWRVVNGSVELDRATLDQKVPWWVVQEIGTGNRATIKTGDGQKGRAGRPSKADVNKPGGRHVSVRSQRGRRIPGSLAFGTGPRGQWVPPSSGVRNQQLHLIADLKGVPHGPLRNKHTAVQDLRIRNEIKPKGFIKSGAREGFRDYKNDVLAAARATLTKRK